MAKIIKIPANNHKSIQLLKKIKKKNIQLKIILPVYRPPKGVRTPQELLIAVREIEPVTGNEETKEPIRLLAPMAIIS
jgi:hypothetical protein